MSFYLKFPLTLAAATSIVCVGCDRSSEPTESHATAATESEHGHPHEAREAAEGADHHEEVPRGVVQIGDMAVELAQGHGDVGPGKEMHLIVKLPYSDNGATVIRAWLGGADRLQSVVAKGEYAPSHDDYDIHAMAPISPAKMTVRSTELISTIPLPIVLATPVPKKNAAAKLKKAAQNTALPGDSTLVDTTVAMEFAAS